MQAAGDLVALAAELAAGVEHREHDLGRRLVGVLGMRVDRDAAPVVDDAAAAIGKQRHIDAGRVARERLVDRVVDDLVDEVVEARRAGRADVHPGPFAHRLEALENGDVLGRVRHALVPDRGSGQRCAGTPPESAKVQVRGGADDLASVPDGPPSTGLLGAPRRGSGPMSRARPRGRSRPARSSPIRGTARGRPGRPVDLDRAHAVAHRAHARVRRDGAPDELLPQPRRPARRRRVRAAEVAADRRERVAAAAPVSPVARPRSSRRSLLASITARRRRAGDARARCPAGSTPAVVSSVWPAGRLRTSAAARGARRAR